MKYNTNYSSKEKDSLYDREALRHLIDIEIEAALSPYKGRKVFLNDLHFDVKNHICARYVLLDPEFIFQDLYIKVLMYMKDIDPFEKARVMTLLEESKDRQNKIRSTLLY